MISPRGLGSYAFVNGADAVGGQSSGRLFVGGNHRGRGLFPTHVCQNNFRAFRVFPWLLSLSTFHFPLSTSATLIAEGGSAPARGMNHRADFLNGMFVARFLATNPLSFFDEPRRRMRCRID
jgi:hypothetical protein